MARKNLLRVASILATFVVALSFVGVAHAAWVFIATIQGSASYTPNKANFYGMIEYPSGSQRWIRALDSYMWWNQARIDWMCGQQWKDYHPAISFDNRGLGDGAANGVHALNWSGTNLPWTDTWGGDDNGDGLAEEIKISTMACSLIAGKEYYVQVIFEDKNWANNRVKTEGLINNSGYWVNVRWRIASEWWCQFKFTRNDLVAREGCN